MSPGHDAHFPPHSRSLKPTSLPPQNPAATRRTPRTRQPLGLFRDSPPSQACAGGVVNLGTAYADGVLPGAGRAACCLHVMPLTSGLHVDYTLFEPSTQVSDAQSEPGNEGGSAGG